MITVETHLLAYVHVELPRSRNTLGAFTRTHTHTHTHTHARTHARTHSRTHTRTHSHTRTDARTYIHAHTYAMSTEIKHERPGQGLCHTKMLTSFPGTIEHSAITLLMVSGLSRSRMKCNRRKGVAPLGRTTMLKYLRAREKIDNFQHVHLSLIWTLIPPLSWFFVPFFEFSFSINKLIALHSKPVGMHTALCFESIVREFVMVQFESSTIC